jgi:hypothetical protein
MTQEQALRLQRELLPGSGVVPNGEPFLTYGIWVLPFTYGSIGLNVLLVDRPIRSEADHLEALDEAIEKLRRAKARPAVI